MCWHYFTWAKEVIFDPKKNTKKDFKYGEFVKRLVVLSLVSGILTTLLAVAAFGSIAATKTLKAAWLAVGIGIPIFILSAIFQPFINAAIFQFFGKIVFKLIKKDYKKTYNAVAYSTVPVLLFSWVPIIGNFIGVIWGIIVGAYALANQQKVSVGRALLVIFLPIIIFLVIIFTAAAVVIGTVGPLVMSQLGFPGFA